MPAAYGYPGYPGGPPGPGDTPSGDDDKDSLPFTTGSTVVISAPRAKDDIVCDVKDGGWGGSAATGCSRRALQAGGSGKVDDNTPVECDHKAGSGPGSEWMPSGFLVMGEDPAKRVLKDGDSIYLESQNTHKFCK